MGTREWLPFPIPHSQLLVREFLREVHDAIEGAGDVRGRGGVGQAHPAVVTERGARDQGHAVLADQPRTETGGADPAEGVDPKEEVEGAQGIDELDAWQRLA